MDILPSGGIFRELQVVHDTGYFSGQASLEEDWHQVPTQQLHCKKRLVIFPSQANLYSVWAHCNAGPLEKGIYNSSIVTLKMKEEFLSWKHVHVALYDIGSIKVGKLGIFFSFVTVQ